MCTKLSLCTLYWSLFQRANDRLIRMTRIMIATTAFIVACVYTASFFVSIFECTPVSKTWFTKKAGTCINLSAFRYSTAAVNIATSVLVITVPLPALFRAKKHRSEISQLIGLILLGLM